MHKKYTSLFLATTLVAGLAVYTYGGELESITAAVTEMETYMGEQLQDLSGDGTPVIDDTGDEFPGETLPDGEGEGGVQIDPDTEGESDPDITIDIPDDGSETDPLIGTEVETDIPFTEIEIIEPETEKKTEKKTEKETIIVDDPVDETEQKKTEADDTEQESENEILLDEEDLGILETDPVETELLEPESETETETETDLGTDLVIDTPISSVVTEAGLGELFIAVSGYPVGDLTENEASVYQYLRTKLGLNKAAACGVLANIYCESNFSTIAIGDGGTSLGLCQWHAGRCRALIGWCDANGYDYRSVEGQLNYLRQELLTGYAGVYEYLLSVPESAQGAYQAGYYFCMYFESPDSVQIRSDARGKIASSSYYPADLDDFANRHIRLNDDGTLQDDLADKEAAEKGKEELEKNDKKNKKNSVNASTLDEKTLRMIRDLDRRLGVRSRDDRLKAAVQEILYSLTDYD